ncbi:hypothetical protein I6E81_12190 [Salinibacterium sp. NG22]|uniref:hypothetical protein n=1 Tax=Salinibacterium sp. NG22 TaxID=2792040 RepID=UPI0018CF3F97|nr:hypothetical protein [Salinibacterium sp. NG22]MBH0110927.1 hypothetical protein [Salinibacterium sp. NG22]
MTLDNGIVVIVAVLAIAMVMVFVRLAKAPNPLQDAAVSSVPRATHQSRSITVASLRARRWWSFAQPRTIAAMAVLAVATLVVHTAVVLVAFLDQGALGGDRATLQFSGVIAALVLVVAASSFFTLRKFAHRAAPPTPEQLVLDVAVRSVAARIVTSLTSALFFALLANAVAMLGNHVSVYLAVRAGQTSSGTVALAVDATSQMLTAVLVIGAIVELIVSIVLATSLIGHKIRGRRALAEQPTA